MTVTLQDIAQAFQQVLSGAKTRPEIVKWAETHMEAYHAGSLKFDSESDEERILDGLLFLEELEQAGDTPDQAQAHTDQDILRYADANDLLEAQ